MRTQEEINLVNLQRHVRDAFVLAKFMGLGESSDLLEQVFASITPNSKDSNENDASNN